MCFLLFLRFCPCFDLSSPPSLPQQRVETEMMRFVGRGSSLQEEDRIVELMRSRTFLYEIRELVSVGQVVVTCLVCRFQSHTRSSTRI